MKMWCSFVYLFKFYFSCKCLFIVTKCSEEINECVSSVCMSKTLYHKSPTIGQFVFLSLLFYTGWFCHQYYNPCELLNEPCKNKSTGLTLANGSYYCICKEGMHLCLFWCLFAIVTHEMMFEKCCVHWWFGECLILSSSLKVFWTWGMLHGIKCMLRNWLTWVQIPRTLVKPEVVKYINNTTIPSTRWEMEQESLWKLVGWLTCSFFNGKQKETMPQYECCG